MAIPPEINALIERLNQELNLIEQQATEGLNLVRANLALFPNNSILIQLFATLNNFMLFIEITKRRIEYDRVLLSSEDITDEQIQEAGEDLSEQLGRVLETKIAVSRVKTILED